MYIYIYRYIHVFRNLLFLDKHRLLLQAGLFVYTSNDIETWKIHIRHQRNQDVLLTETPNGNKVYACFKEISHVNSA